MITFASPHMPVIGSVEFQVDPVNSLRDDDLLEISFSDHPRQFLPKNTDETGHRGMPLSMVFSSISADRPEIRRDTPMK